MITWATSWIAEQFIKGFWGFMYDFITDLIDSTIQLIKDFILMETDINMYINVSAYMKYIYIFATSLLVVKLVWKVVFQISGTSLDEELGIGELIKRTIFSASLIYVLPWFLLNVILKINNSVMELITQIGVDLSNADLKRMFLSMDLTKTMILILLILAIAFLILGVVSGIRYVEVIICYLVAPIVATSVINDVDKLNVWIVESISIIFTQSLQLFLLQVLVGVIFKINNLFSYFVAIGVVTVMIKGPQIIRKYAYKTGSGSAAVKSVGGMGKTAALKFISK